MIKQAIASGWIDTSHFGEDEIRDDYASYCRWARNRGYSVPTESEWLDASGWLEIND
jgi:hypothetical protein